MLKGLTCAAVVLAAAGLANAQGQQWELGAIGGVGFSPNLTVKNATASASASVRPGVTVGFYAGEDLYRFWSGEATYLYRAGNLKLEGGGSVGKHCSFRNALNSPRRRVASCTRSGVV